MVNLVFLHDLVVPYDLHSHIGIVTGLVSSANDIGEHTLPRVPVNCVSVV